MWNFKKNILRTYNDLTAQPVTSYSYTGVYAVGDPAHPNGGSFNYIDAFGVSKSKTSLFSNVCFTFDSQSPPTNKIGVAVCIP